MAHSAQLETKTAEQKESDRAYERKSRTYSIDGAL
jgi:hypothetical protein